MRWCVTRRARLTVWHARSVTSRLCHRSVGAALEIRVELRDHLGNPATQAATGDVRLDDVKATLLRTVDGSVVKVVNVAAETTTSADDTTVVVLKVYPRVKGATELQVTVFGEAVQVGRRCSVRLATSCRDSPSISRHRRTTPGWSHRHASRRAARVRGRQQCGVGGWQHLPLCGRVRADQPRAGAAHSDLCAVPWWHGTC